MVDGERAEGGTSVYEPRRGVETRERPKIFLMMKTKRGGGGENENANRRGEKRENGQAKNY